ncbi:hypothetical protein RDI58_000959 [Solanum bulbocastanum]|uniref:UBN2_3 domain-containing protein n=1 Tax=Solanum bulbocastanum TaxID=147425 RepID=A0AAN8YPI9_SOLBU
MVLDAMTSIKSSITSATFSPTTLSHTHHFIYIKLTLRKYLFWCTQLFPFFCGKNLHGYIDGSTPCPPSTISESIGVKPNSDYTHWIQQDQLIFSLLISSLSEETLPIIIGLNTTKEVWDALAATLSSPSNTRLFNLHMQF